MAAFFRSYFRHNAWTGGNEPCHLTDPHVTKSKIAFLRQRSVTWTSRRTYEPGLAGVSRMGKLVQLLTMQIAGLEESSGLHASDRIVPSPQR